MSNQDQSQLVYNSVLDTLADLHETNDVEVLDAAVGMLAVTFDMIFDCAPDKSAAISLIQTMLSAKLISENEEECTCLDDYEPEEYDA
jgi:hypothetical protein